MPNNPLRPSIPLLAKIGSILVHVEEGTSKTGHEFDWIAVRSLLDDPEVVNWLAAMRADGLLPVKRAGR